MRRKTIHIKWSPKLPIQDYNKSKYMDSKGVYMITRKWGEYSGLPREETILYIGKTIDAFSRRLKDHTEYWIPDLRGSIYVRFGTILLKDYDNDLLEDIESALIFCEQPIKNLCKTESYAFRTNYLVNIINDGFYGPLTKNIDARGQVDWNTVE